MSVRVDAHGWLGKAAGEGEHRLAVDPVVGQLAVAPPGEHLDHLVGDLLQLGRAQPQPVLGREGRVLPLGVGVGVGHPVAQPLLLAACAQGLGLLRRGDGRLVDEVAPAPAGARGDETPPPLAPVAGQLGCLLDQPGRGQHLEVVARVADGLAGARREHRGGRRAVDLERVHDPRAERVGQRGQRGGVAQGADLGSGHAHHA